MFTKVNLVCFVLLCTLNFSFAKYYQSYQNLVSNNNSDDYYYDDEVCEPSSLPPHPDSMCCGVDSTSSNRIIGGAPTALFQYPWLAMIEYKILKYQNWLTPRCGGSLISGRHVLTAAHCVAGEILLDSTPYNVILGDYDKHHEGPDCITTKEGKQCNEGAVRIRIDKIFAHEKFGEKTMKNDIALVKLKTMAPYNNAIRPICLPFSNLLNHAQRNQFLYAAGWGTMKQKCKSVWRSLVTENHICAGGEGGKDACMGDSGGPLMNDNDGIFDIVGVVSFGAGDPCGKPGVPGVYTNVYRYKDWIAHRLRL
ncbi:phenoloxidase-activating enzyme-like isoform X2 [Pectinophora gossypiella]|uniref:phenoloxidase-activating enzyme-like isoform X2 n=1 Tax=Pectinophora gossypiella TaxID=13191 RepID=UPI00214E4D09|nr:phenoloxidase-activating enzyme-like isoform X2 [Pectinophora gossypiella]